MKGTDVLNTESISSRLVRLGWLMWSAAMLVQLLNLFHRVAGATIADRLMADFNLSATIVGNVTALFFYVYAPMQFPSGALADSLGPRKTISIGALISGVGSLIFATAHSLPLLFLGRFLASFGVSFVMINTLKLAANWFPNRSFGFMTAFTGVASQGGALMATTPLALLMVLVGWRGSFELVGILSLAFGALAWFIIRDRPQDMGLPSPAQLEQARSASPRRPPASKLGAAKRLKLLFGNRYIWSPFFMGIGVYGTVLTFTGAWGTSYLMQIYHMTRTTATNYMLVNTAAMMASSLVVAYLSNKVVRKRKPFAIGCISVYLCLWLLLTFWSPGKLSPFALSAIFVSLGLAYGYQPQNLACTKELSPPGISGLAMGLVNVGPFLTPAILQPVFGMILDAGWQGAVSEGARVYPVAAYHSAFLLICGAAAIAWVASLMLKESGCRDVFGQD